MIFRKADISDADAVTAIYDKAREILKNSGIPQWQGGVPGRESFLLDIENGQAYVLEDDSGRVVATVQIMEYEPYYERIENGRWSEPDALVAHHVAVADDCRKKGMGSRILEYVSEIAVQKGKKALRLDTHAKNFRMRGLLEKNGFKVAGVVHMTDGSERIAYEKIL